MNLKYILSGTFLLVAIAGTYALYTTTTGPSERTTPPVKNQASQSITTSTIAPPQKVPVKSIVTITSDTTLGVGNTTFLGDKTSPDFIHVAVQGTIVEFKFVSISFDGEKNCEGQSTRGDSKYHRQDHHRRHDYP